MVEFGGIPDINLKNIKQNDMPKPDEIKLSPEEIALFGDISRNSCPVNAVPESIFGSGPQPSYEFPSVEPSDFSSKSRYIREPESLQKTAKAQPVVITPEKTQITAGVGEVASTDTSQKKHKVTIGDMELDMDIAKSVNENGDTVFSGEVHVDGGVVKYQKTKSADGESVITVFQGDDGTMRAEYTTDNAHVKHSSVEQRYMYEDGNMFAEHEIETAFKETGITTTGYGYSTGDGTWIDFQDVYDADGNYAASAFTQTGTPDNPDPVTIQGENILSKDGSGFEFVPSDTNADIVVVKYGEGIVSTKPRVSQDVVEEQQHLPQTEQHEPNIVSITSSEQQHVDELPDFSGGAEPVVEDSSIPVEEPVPFVPDFSDATNQFYRVQNKN